jgi:hypothetical protein
MSLVQRRPRPLSRYTGSLRDDRLFIIACDDTFAPKQYFDFFRIPRVQIHVIPTEDGTSVAPRVLERLLKIEHEEDDELWLVLDVDHCGQGPHLQNLVTTIAEARKKGIRVALSRPSFELWLLLHHVSESNIQGLATAKDVEAELRAALGEYNKARLKQAHYPLTSVRVACERAEKLDGSVGGGDVPAANTTRVFRIWKSIAAKALPSQLPGELRGL